jgi:methylaspartate ammonia-lyase
MYMNVCGWEWGRLFLFEAMELEQSDAWQRCAEGKSIVWGGVCAYTYVAAAAAFVVSLAEHVQQLLAPGVCSDSQG